MNIKKKDIKSFCELLACLAGTFALFSSEGKLLYSADGLRIDGEMQRHEIPADGTSAGYILGLGENCAIAAGLIGHFLKSVADRRKLTEHTLQKYREMSFLAEINRILGSSTDITEILCAATRKIHDMIAVESCSVMVADYKTGRFVLKVISGRAVNEPLEMKIDEGICGMVLASGNPVIANNPAEYSNFIAAGKVEINSLLSLPLKVKDSTIGILNLRNKNDGLFTSEDEALLTSMCVTIAEVIDNARLLEEKIRDEKFSAIGQMAAGIIHDIKNPMTTIKGFAGLLGDLDFTMEERKEYSSMIVGEVNRLVNMLEDLLAFTRGFKSTMSLENVSAEEYLSEVVAYIENDMKARKINVSLRLDYKGGLLIDPEKFKRVMFNIAGNAREAIHDGGRFLILSRPAGDFVEIVFSDSGSGVPDDIINTIFDPFVTRGKKSGTGLGLAISRKIIEEHGGSIRAVNGNYSGVEGFNGANFAIMLPEC